MELTVQNLYGLLLRSNLLSRDDARAMFARWQEEAKGSSADAAQFAAWMVEQKYVTAYQANLLARGHADGFFLGEYTVLERIGKGRMAGVYKARHELGQVVAVKVLPPSKAADPHTLARFQREARLALRLRHPNVVRAFEVGVAGDLHYLVMEHLEGETLDEVLARRRQLPPPEGVRLVHQALGGLQHIHEQGVVHRDLKPANLMLVPGPGAGDTFRSTVKVLDIGLGRALFEEPGLDGADAELTVEGIMLGTPDYMAPEQARDPRAADIRSDVYSLGCVLYHLLAGRPPFPDTNIISQMIRHATEAPRPLREFNPAVPDALQQIVARMMAKDPAQRFPTPARAAQALEGFLVVGGDPPSSPDLDPQMRPYLTWLEGQPGRRTPAPTARPPSSPDVPAAATKKPDAPAREKPEPPPTKPDAPARETKPEAQAREPPREDAGPGRGTGKRKGKRGRNRPPPPPAAGPPAFHLELTPPKGGPLRTGESAPPASPAAPKPTPPGGLRLTARDFVLFGLGAATVLLAIGIGFLFAYLAR